MPQEVHEIAAVGLDRVVREPQHIADPGHAPAVVSASLPVASSTRARKASTLAAAGESPSRKSLRSGTRGARGVASSASGMATAGRVGEGVWSMTMILPDETREHKADYVPSSEGAARRQKDGRKGVISSGSRGLGGEGRARESV